MSWYIEALKKYAVFSGRARRKEYWLFALFNVVIGLGLVAIDTMAGTGFLNPLYSLGVLIPSLAVGVRRLHDTGRGGWWLLVVVIPVFGIIVLWVFCAQDSQSGDNEYGSNPKGVESPNPEDAPT